MPRNAFLLACGLVVLFCGRVARADLSSEELVLIVNRNVPQSRELAEFYRQVRQVPEGRILELDLPNQDRLPRATYDEVVVPAVRGFLEQNGLKGKVRCLVTFYGVPLAVDGKQLTEAERQERAQVNREAQELGGRFAGLVREAEGIVKEVGYQPPPWVGRDLERLDVLLGRLAAAEAFLGRQKLTDEQRRQVGAKIAELRKRLDEPLEPAPPAERNAEGVPELLARSDAEGRGLARRAMRMRAPLPEYAELLSRHQRLLAEEDSDASFDSELACLWIDNAPAALWLVNPLAQRGGGQPAAGPQVLMTSRLDGRDAEQVRSMIETGLRVEQRGLNGKIVIDSRGIAAEGPNGKPDGYGVFDEQLRRLAKLLKERAKLPVVHDDLPAVIAPPGERDVAVYVGWYSLMKYVPAFEFAEGAVGYHVASFEMRSLRDPRMPGWVPGLLENGVVATVGPVSEPYLSAFPPPEEFFPLLLTGELTLAEVYWRTVPLMSWKMGLIGDPLYRPFGAQPAMPLEALPVPLRTKARDL